MQPMIADPRLDLLLQPGEATEDDVRTQVWGLLTTLYPKHDMLERRRETRYPFPYLVHLTPVGDDGASPEGEAIVVVGKHLSERGLGFYHTRPLPYRRMVVSLEAGDGQWGGLPHRPELVPLHEARLVRKRRPISPLGVAGGGNLGRRPVAAKRQRPRRNGQ